MELTTYNHTLLTELKLSLKKAGGTQNNSEPEPQKFQNIPKELQELQSHFIKGTVSPNNTKHTESILMRASNYFPLVTTYWEASDKYRITNFKEIFDKLAQKYKNQVLFAHINDKGLDIEEKLELDFWAKENRVTDTFISVDNIQTEYDDTMDDFNEHITKTTKAMRRIIPLQFGVLDKHFKEGTLAVYTFDKGATKTRQTASQYVPVIIAQYKYDDFITQIQPTYEAFAKNNKGKVLCALVKSTNMNTEKSVQLHFWEHDHVSGIMHVTQGDIDTDKSEELERRASTLIEKFQNTQKPS
jgi:hypothetical protein